MGLFFVSHAGAFRPDPMRTYVRMSGRSFDWEAIRRHYEAGYTRTQCQEKFGFSNGAWNRAVERGELTPRRRSSGLRAGKKRERIRELRESGCSYSEIAAELGADEADRRLPRAQARDSG